MLEAEVGQQGPWHSTTGLRDGCSLTPESQGWHIQVKSKRCLKQVSAAGGRAGGRANQSVSGATRRPAPSRRRIPPSPLPCSKAPWPGPYAPAA